MCCRSRRDQNSIDNYSQEDLVAAVIVAFGLAEPQEINIAVVRVVVIIIELGVMAKHHASITLVKHIIVVDNYWLQSRSLINIV